MHGYTYAVERVPKDQLSLEDRDHENSVFNLIVEDDPGTVIATATVHPAQDAYVGGTPKVSYWNRSYVTFSDLNGYEAEQVKAMSKLMTYAAAEALYFDRRQEARWARDKETNDYLESVGYTPYRHENVWR